MEDLSLHILDVVENSIAAKAKRIEIRIKMFIVWTQGSDMTKEQLNKLIVEGEGQRVEFKI